MDELNRLIPSLVTSLEGKAIPGTSALRGDIRNALAATDRLFWRFGFPEKGASRAMRPSWAPVITKLSDRPGGPDEKQVELRMTRLVEDVFWLRDELGALNTHYSGKSPGTRKFKVRQFCHGALRIYAAMFDRPVGVSTAEGGDQPSGPVIRFLTAVFEELRLTLEKNDLISMAKDKALAPSDYTLRFWTRKFIEYNQ